MMHSQLAGCTAVFGELGSPVAAISSRINLTEVRLRRDYNHDYLLNPIGVI